MSLTKYVRLTANYVFMFQASHFYITCRETWKLEKPDCGKLSHTKNGTSCNTESHVYVSTDFGYSCLIFYCVNIDAIAIIVLFVFRTKHIERSKTKKMKLKVHAQVSRETTFSRMHTKTLCNASHRSLIDTDT